MISLKRTKKELKPKAFGPSCYEEQDVYPYGTKICLGTEDLKKLGVSELPEVGEVYTITAKVKVVEVSQRDQKDGKSRSLDLQITDLELPPEMSSGEEDDEGGDEDESDDSKAAPRSKMAKALEKM